MLNKSIDVLTRVITLDCISNNNVWVSLSPQENRSVPHTEDVEVLLYCFHLNGKAEWTETTHCTCAKVGILPKSICMILSLLVNNRQRIYDV